MFLLALGVVLHLLVVVGVVQARQGVHQAVVLALVQGVVQVVAEAVVAEVLRLAVFLPEELKWPI